MLSMMIYGNLLSTEAFRRERRTAKAQQRHTVSFGIAPDATIGLFAFVDVLNSFVV